MLRDTEDVAILVGPNLAVAGGGEVFGRGEEYEVGDGFKDTNAILDFGMILKDLYPTPVDDSVRKLMNFEPRYLSHHLRKL